MGEENIFPARTHFSCSLVNHSHKGSGTETSVRSEWHEPSRLTSGSINLQNRRPTAESEETTNMRIAADWRCTHCQLFTLKRVQQIERSEEWLARPCATPSKALSFGPEVGKLGSSLHAGQHTPSRRWRDYPAVSFLKDGKARILRLFGLDGHSAR
jgi:hypothetical protein